MSVTREPDDVFAATDRVGGKPTDVTPGELIRFNQR